MTTNSTAAAANNAPTVNAAAAPVVNPPNNNNNNEPPAPSKVSALVDDASLTQSVTQSLSQSVSQSMSHSVDGTGSASASQDAGNGGSANNSSIETPSLGADPNIQPIPSSRVGAPSGKQRRHKKPVATPLRFLRIHGRQDIARVQLLLCNISDRALYYKLKSNAGSNISSITGGSGHIGAHSSERIDLTWKRPENVASWKDLEAPKLLLVTRFLDANSEISNDANDATMTRLLAHVASKGSCPATSPPVEQLLLDAAKPNVDGGESDKREDNNLMSVSKVIAPEEAQPKAQTLGDFVAELTPQQFALLILCILLLHIALYNSLTRSDRRGRD